MFQNLYLEMKHNRRTTNELIKSNHLDNYVIDSMFDFVTLNGKMVKHWNKRLKVHHSHFTFYSCFFYSQYFEWYDSLPLYVSYMTFYYSFLQTKYENGELILTSHRMIWRNPGIERRFLCLPLSSVILIEQENAGFMKSAKLVLQLSQLNSGSNQRVLSAKALESCLIDVLI